MDARNATLAAAILSAALIALPAAAHAAPPVWSPPVDVSDPAQNAAAYDMVVAPDGTMTAAWSNSDGTDTALKASVSTDDGGVWSSSVDISTSGALVGIPDLAVAEDSSLIVVWDEFDGANYRIWSSTSGNGGVAWSAPVALTPTGVNSTQARIEISESGAAMVVWQQITGIAGKVFVSTSTTAGATWGAPIQLSDPLNYAYLPQVASSGSVAVVAWAGYELGVLVTQTATSTDGGATWGPRTSVPGTGFDAQSQQVAIDSTGRITTVWSTADGSNAVIQAAYSDDDGGTWSPAAIISELGVNSFSQIGLVSASSTTAVWLTLDGTYSVRSASLPADGSSWSPPVTLSSSGGSVFKPDLAIGPDGSLIAVWHFSLDGVFSVQVVSSTDRGLTWSVPITVHPADEEGVGARVATGQSGVILVIWYNLGGAGSYLKAAAAQPEVVPTPSLAATGAPILPWALMAMALLGVGVLSMTRRAQRALRCQTTSEHSLFDRSAAPSSPGSTRVDAQREPRR